MADSVLGTILRSALSAETPKTLPEHLAGLGVDDLREAFAALADVGPPGIALASAAVVSADAGDVGELLSVASHVDVPVVVPPLDEPVLAGVIDTWELDHRSLLDDAMEGFDSDAFVGADLDDLADGAVLPEDVHGVLDGMFSVDDLAATEVDVVDDAVAFDHETVLDDEPGFDDDSVDLGLDVVGDELADPGADSDDADGTDDAL